MEEEAKEKPKIKAVPSILSVNWSRKETREEYVLLAKTLSPGMMEWRVSSPGLPVTTWPGRMAFVSALH